MKIHSCGFMPSDAKLTFEAGSPSWQLKTEGNPEDVTLDYCPWCGLRLALDTRQTPPTQAELATALKKLADTVDRYWRLSATSKRPMPENTETALAFAKETLKKLGRRQTGRT